MKEGRDGRSTTEKTSDSGKVRIGGMAPAIATQQTDRKTADAGKVRIGGMAPVF